MRILAHPFGTGNRSDRYLIEENKKLYVLKMTDDEELYIGCKYVPKLLSVNSRKYQKYNTDSSDYTYKNIYKYEYIKGKKLHEVTITDFIFVNLLKTMNYFYRKGFRVWDCHIDNFVLTKKKRVILVDLGSLEPIEHKTYTYVFSFGENTSPEEYGSSDINTEAFAIYRIGFSLKTKCVLSLSIKNEKTLAKMCEKQMKNRYQSFNEILNEINGFL